MLRCFIQRSGGVALLGFLIAFSSSAQSDRGSVTGTVTSHSGAPLANATVTLQNASNSSTQQTTSDGSGKYRFDNVPAGSYRMSTTSNGVTSSPSNTITVAAGEISTVNLNVGAPPAAPAAPPTSPVTSVEQAPSTQEMTGPRISTAWNQRNIQYLPEPNLLEPTGQDYTAYNLSLLSAGVASNSGIGPSRGPVVGGQRPYENDFLIGGMDNNNRTNPGPLTYISNDAIEEFRVQQNQFSPEYGHAAGGQLNAVVREGSNALHGEAYEYFQNTNLDSLDSIYAREGITSPRYDQNRVGGNVGFPIVKNKLFFFGDFEYIPLGFDEVPGSIVYAPTGAGYATLAGIPGVSANNLAYLQRSLPAANFASSSTIVDGTTIPLGVSPLFARAYQNQYNGVASLDWKISTSDSLAVRYIQNDLHANSEGAELPEFYTPFGLRALIASLSEVHNFSSGAVNELRLSYNRDDSNLGVNGVTFPGFGFAATPTISIQQDLNATLGAGLFGPTSTALSTYSLADNITWVHGHHTVHIGYDGRRYIGPVSFAGEGAGILTYSSLQPFLMNLPPDVYGARAFGGNTITTNQWDSYAYIKDDWQVTPDLTIDIGARYEFVGLPQFMKYQGLNSYLDVPGVIDFHSPKAQSDAWAPTVGLAYSPGFAHNSVFRAGFGMNYDATAYTSLMPYYFGGAAGTMYTTGLLATPGFLSPTTPFFGAAPTGAAGVSTYFPNQQLPYTMQWNASWEQQIFRRFLLSVRYLGVRGEHLPTAGLLNGTSVVTASNSLPLYYSAPYPATLNGLTTTLGGLTPYNSLAAYGFTNPILTMNDNGESFYNGLSVQANQRFSGGFQLIAAYTWSHLIDDLSTPLLAGTPSWVTLDALGPKESSIYDHRQRGTLTGLWDLGALGRNGWVRDIVTNMTVSGTYIYETPSPVTIISGLDTGLTGFENSAVLVNPAGIPGTGSGVTPLTNSSSQTVAYLANNPNARYIAGAPGVYTGAGREFFFGWPINDFDASLSKRFAIRERFQIEFRCDAFNILNHPQYTPGELNNIGLPVATSLNYMIPGTAQFDNAAQAFASQARVLQLSAKVVF